ncbi:type II toxin-antitoxin system VapB family antitoxin [Pseudaquabacterium rugosum]|uniref:Type II toxin-antitoxin system VapB family antitoxin n=1 Tax=Pseudaquabacterium rugosum TaxID=2984194 RepID=A0ABU9BHL0_9BURK
MSLTVTTMRITLEIDDALMREVLRLTGLKSRKEAVDMGLRTLLLRLRKQEALRQLRGHLRWEGDLNAMRTDT